MTKTTVLSDDAMSQAEIDSFDYHHSVESLGHILCNRTSKNDMPFFRMIAAYYICTIASTMRAKVTSPAYGKDIPVNCYLLALATSGFGKGKSTGTMEQELLGDFNTMFQNYVMPDRTEQNLWKLAMQWAAWKGTTDQDEYDKFLGELNSCGEYPPVFDGASEPAIKQIRDMLLRTDCGSINYQVDEIGSNLEKSTEAMNVYFELFDKGLVKSKLKMNNSDQKRLRNLKGSTPANMLLFGTPTKLMDSGPIEKKFYSLVETGMGRRMLYAYGDPTTSIDLNRSVSELYDCRANPQNEQDIQTWAKHFANMADLSKINWTIEMPRHVGEKLLSYEKRCKQLAQQFGMYRDIEKVEMEHRFFKTMKLAGAFAFIDETLTMSEEHLNSAIKMVEDSGKAFDKIMSQEPAYTKLARYIAECGDELTHADLDNRLPFYKGSGAVRNEMLTMATAWGYKEHIIIKRRYVDTIEFISGETLEKTQFDDIRLSWSDDLARDYQWESAPFDQLHQLATLPNHHWANHEFQGGHRREENVIPGFNLLVLDVDGTSTLDFAHELLEDYTFLTYTTKRHTPDTHRFRLILPMNYHLELDADDYRTFMQNIVEWLPFKVDDSTFQRSRKWQTHDQGSYHYNLAQSDQYRFLDVLPFIPQTSRNEEHQKKMTNLQSLDNLERWFAQRFDSGNRNNLMIKYALALVDAGFQLHDVTDRVLAFNKKISNGLSKKELEQTVLKTVASRMQGQAAA